MTPPFSVSTSTHFKRLFHRLRRRHHELDGIYERVVEILRQDPFNRNRRHDILKLEGVALGHGRWRLALGPWRFRYDIFEHEVVLFYVGIRREETYR